jgi:hypothetical protein
MLRTVSAGPEPAVSSACRRVIWRETFEQLATIFAALSAIITLLTVGQFFKYKT